MTPMISAGKLIGLDPSAIHDYIKSPVEVVFSDGSVVMTPQELYATSLAWELFRRHPAYTGPFQLCHSLTHVIKDGLLTSGSYNKLMTSIVFSIFDATPGATNKFLTETLARDIYEVNCNIYNQLIVVTEAYVTTNDIVDFAQILNDPRIREAKQTCDGSDEALSATKNRIMGLIKKDPAFVNNNLAVAVRAGVVKNDQVAQCIGPRGKITDIDSHLFRYPVMRGYAEGLRSIHDSLIESRSASKSYLLAQGELKETEYFSRRLQFVCQNLQRLHFTDCGSETYVAWPVRDRKDLQVIHGANYLRDDGTLAPVQPNDLHLVGKVLQLRNVIYCKHHDHGGVCSTCVGQMSYSFLSDTVIGHMASTTMNALISQGVLSTKHLDGNAAAESVNIMNGEEAYLRADETGLGFMFTDAVVKQREWYFVIDHREAKLLSEVQNSEDLEGVTPNQVTALTKICLLTDPAETKGIVLTLGEPGRPAYLSKEFLQYMKLKGWDMTPKGNYVIPIDEWDYNLPFACVPMKQFNMADHSKKIEQKIEGTTKDVKDRYAKDPSQFLIEFSDLVNDRIDVNLATLSCIVYSYMCRQPYQYDYRFPKEGRRFIGIKNDSIIARSLSASMAYEDHKQTFSTPLSFVKTNRPDHGFDRVLMPAEAR